MWRTVALKAALPKNCIPIQGQKVQHAVRTQHTDSSKGGSGGTKTALAVLGAITVGAVGAVAYSQQDPKFRKRMQDNLPYGDTIFAYIPDWGEKSKIPNTKEITKEKESGLLKQKIEREKAKQREEPVVITPPPPPPPTMKIEPEAPIPEPIHRTAAAKPVSDQKRDDLAKRKWDEESNAALLNKTLEVNIAEGKEKLETLLLEATRTQQAAVEAVKEHATKIFKALDENLDSNDYKVWNEVREAQQEKISTLAKATDKLIDIKSALDSLQSHIDEGKRNQSTRNNASLMTGEEALESSQHTLKIIEEKLSDAQLEGKAANLYKELIERGRTQLQTEMEAFLPPDSKGRQLTEEELNLLLGHAHRRLLQLQRQLAKQEATEQLRVRHALEDMKRKTESNLGDQISQQLEKQKRIAQEEARRMEAKILEEFELEMRQQLRRQAAAHSDHLQEALTVREAELSRQAALQCQEALLKQQGVHQEQVGNAMSRLKGMQHYLQAREELERASRKAQQIWLACQALRQAVRFGVSGTSLASEEATLKPLQGQVAAIKEAAGNQDPLYDAVLKAIPSRALERGVFTEEALRHRFSNVEKTCRKLAMLEDYDSPADISLYRYFLSYLRSFLVIDTWGNGGVTSAQLEAELNGKVAVEPRKWSTGQILARARACLERRELEQALRYASQLKGEPARAAHDWLTEARIALETRQAADALMAQASAVTVQAYH